MTAQATIPIEQTGRRFRLPGLQRASALYLLVFILVLFGIWIPNTFLTATTFRVVGGDQVVVAILALALLIPLTAGVFDLSVGNMLAFSLVIVSWFQANTGLNGFVSAALAVLACAAVGFVSGLIVVRFRVDSFIATLAMSQILAAATLYISANKQIVGVLVVAVALAARSGAVARRRRKLATRPGDQASPPSSDPSGAPQVRDRGEVIPA
jgi:ribose transport system permease protein